MRSPLERTELLEIFHDIPNYFTFNNLAVMACFEDEEEKQTTIKVVE